MATYLQILVSGTATGVIYGLIALSFTLLYSTSKVMNFALGELVMIGAVSSYFLLAVLGFPWLVTLALMCLIVGMISVGMAEIVVSPLLARGASPITVVIATFAIATVLGTSTLRAFGPLGYPVPGPFGQDAILVVGDAPILVQNLIVIAAGALVTLALWLVLGRTMFGLAFRATGFSQDAASSIGINIGTIRLASLIVSGCIAGLVGTLLAPLIGAHPLMGFPFLVKGFLAAIVGGLGEPYAGMAGGLILGLVSSALIILGLGALADMIVFGILIMVLLFRPRGLFGGAMVE